MIATVERHALTSIGPCLCLTVNLLRALCFGMVRAFCRDALWLLVLEVLCGKHAPQEDTVGLVTQCVVDELGAWYKRKHATTPLYNLALFRVSRKRLGDVSHRTCKNNGSDGWSKLCFDTAGLGNRLLSTNNREGLPTLPTTSRSHRWT